MPSWNTSVASAGSEPGALPPTSVQCEIEMAKANSSPSHEHRLDHAHVVVVGAAAVGVVEHVDVAGPDALAELLLDAVDLEREGAGEDGDAVGLGYELAVRIAEAAGEIEHLVDDRAHAAPREHHAHLVGHGQQLAAHRSRGSPRRSRIRCLRVHSCRLPSHRPPREAWRRAGSPSLSPPWKPGQRGILPGSPLDGSKLIRSLVPVACAILSSVLVDGRLRPLSSRATTDCVVSIRSASSAWVSLARVRASIRQRERSNAGQADHRLPVIRSWLHFSCSSATLLIRSTPWHGVTPDRFPGGRLRRSHRDHDLAALGVGFHVAVCVHDPL